MIYFMLSMDWEVYAPSDVDDAEHEDDPSDEQGDNDDDGDCSPAGDGQRPQRCLVGGHAGLPRAVSDVSGPLVGHALHGPCVAARLAAHEGLVVLALVPVGRGQFGLGASLDKEVDEEALLRLAMGAVGQGDLH